MQFQSKSCTFYFLKCISSLIRPTNILLKNLAQKGKRQTLGKKKTFIEIVQNGREKTSYSPTLIALSYFSFLWDMLRTRKYEILGAQVKKIYRNSQEMLGA